LTTGVVGLKILLQLGEGRLGPTQIVRLERLANRVKIGGEGVLGLTAGRGIGHQLLQICKGGLCCSQIAGLQVTTDGLKVLLELGEIVLPIGLIGLVRVSS